MSEINRMNILIQRLDELSDEGPSELAGIAEEMGEMVNRLDDRITALQNRRLTPEERMPEYLAKIKQVMEEYAGQILYQRYGNGISAGSSPYMNITIPNPSYYTNINPL